MKGGLVVPSPHRGNGGRSGDYIGDTFPGIHGNLTQLSLLWLIAIISLSGAALGRARALVYPVGAGWQQSHARCPGLTARYLLTLTPPTPLSPTHSHSLPPAHVCGCQCEVLVFVVNWWHPDKGDRVRGRGRGREREKVLWERERELERERNRDSERVGER